MKSKSVVNIARNYSGYGISITEVTNTTKGKAYNKSYLVVIPKQLTGKERIRKQFRVQEEAFNFVHEVIEGIDKQGKAWFDIPYKELKTFYRRFFELEQAGLTVNKAIDLALAANSSSKGKITKVTSKLSSKPAILTVKETKRLLNAAKRTDLLPFTVLGLFAGIRTEELLKLEWRAVDIEQRQVVVSNEITNDEHSRIVDLPKNAIKWLLLYQGRVAKIVKIKESSFYRLFSDLKKDAGIFITDENKINILRNSFAAYHYALFNDAAFTASELGYFTDANSLFDYYKKMVTKEQAKAYFNIIP